MLDKGSASGQRLVVDGSAAVPESRRDRQRPVQVNMHVRNVPTGGRNSQEGPSRALPWIVGRVYTRVHARQSFPTPAHKPLGLQLDGSVGPGMVEAVEGVKYLAPETCGCDLPPLWSGCVTVKVDVRSGNVHPF